MFKRGDKVQLISHINDELHIGTVGTVRQLEAGGITLVQFDRGLSMFISNKDIILDPGHEEDSTVALKRDYGKVRLELLSPIALNEIGRVLTQGAIKYKDHNWRLGFKWSRLLGAALRHLMAFIGGQDKDPETGLSHLAHLGCCVMFLLEHEVTHKELDDRHKVINNE